MPETQDFTVVPMNADDREQLMVVLRDPGQADLTWLRTFVARYDIARSFRDALLDRPERVENLCEPAGDFAQVVALDPEDADGYLITDLKHERYHSVHADLWDCREKA